MTDIEVFEAWFKTTKWFTGDNCTPKYRTYRSMLQAWQASSQRQGFKLVPLEPTKEMYLAGTEELIQIDFSDVYDSDSIQIYKAMINAV